MDFEETRQLADIALFSVNERHLTDPELTVLRGAWERITYQQMAEASQYTLNYLMRDIGPNLWRQLSQALGEEVSKTNFKAALERYKRSHSLNTLSRQQLQVNSGCHQDWGNAIDVSSSRFYGRLQEIKTLKQWVIEEQCKLVTVWGLVEIGKSSLVAKVAEEVQNNFNFVIWRSLNSKPSFSDWLSEIIQFLSQDQAIELANDPQTQISQLLELMRLHRCLIILDGVEKILSPSSSLPAKKNIEVFQQGYESYGNLFKRIAQDEHKSCLILTTQKKPFEIACLSGKRLPVKDLQLKGLAADSARKILQDKGIDIKTYREEVDHLIEKYEGHPVMLIMLSTMIQEVFLGDVAAFVQYSNTTIMFAKVLQQQYEQLSDLEKQIVQYLAQGKETAISLNNLKEGLSLDSWEMMSAIASLKGQSFLEMIKETDPATKTPQYTLPYVIKRYVNFTGNHPKATNSLVSASDEKTT